MKKGLSANIIKIIAVVTMVIDHIAAVLITPAIKKYSWSFSKPQTFFQTGDVLCVIYYVMRMIGRIAFPIFCYLIIEGFVHTKSKIKYAAKLLLFGIISEVPFDLAFRNSILEFNKQNVFFTLFIGLITIWAVCVIRELLMKKIPSLDETSQTIYGLIREVISIAVICIGMLIAILTKTDYSGDGVLAIGAMYLMHEWVKYKPYRSTSNVMIMATGIIALSISSIEEAIALIILPVMAMYNGSRGKGGKYFFYIFYPAHILLLYIIKVLIY